MKWHWLSFSCWTSGKSKSRYAVPVYVKYGVGNCWLVKSGQKISISLIFCGSPQPYPSLFLQIYKPQLTHKCKKSRKFCSRTLLKSWCMKLNPLMMGSLLGYTVTYPDILEEHPASIFKVEEWLFYVADGGHTFFWNIGNNYQTMWHHKPEDSNLHNQHHENFKSYTNSLKSFKV